MDTVRLGLMDMDKRLGFGDYHPVTSGEDRGTITWETWIYTDVGGGIEITFTDEFGAGTYEYAPMPPNRGDIDLGQTAKLRNNSPREIYKRAAHIEPNYYAPEEESAPLDFHYSLADFRGEDDRSLLEIYYGVPILPAHYDSDENITRQVLTHHAALISSTLDTVYRESEGLTYEVQGNKAGEGIQVPGVLKLNLPPGAYRLEVKAQDRLRGRMGAYRQQVVVEPYGEAGLQISDLELAWNVASEKAGSPFNKGDLNVVPLPSRTFKQGQGVFVYYEIYNLSTTTGSMSNPRMGDSGTLLPDGRVAFTSPLQHTRARTYPVEIFDPRTGIFTPIGFNPAFEKISKSMVLSDGKILAFGRSGAIWTIDPETGEFEFKNRLAVPRGAYTATILQNGRVLIAGGVTERAVKDSEIYDPSSNVLTKIGGLTRERFRHLALLLPDGGVFIAGGGRGHPASSEPVIHAERFDPATKTFAEAGSPGSNQAWSGRVLQSGKVFLILRNGDVVLYDPASATFQPTGDSIGRDYSLYTVTVLRDGRVLVIGGTRNGETMDQILAYRP